MRDLPPIEYTPPTTAERVAMLEAMPVAVAVTDKDYIGGSTIGEKS